MNNKEALKLSVNLNKTLGNIEPPIIAANIAKFLGLDIIECVFDDKYNSVYSFLDEDKIYINKNISFNLQNLSIAREIGQLLINGKEYINSDQYKVNMGKFEILTNNQIEVLPNFFAINLIAPKFLVKRYFDYAKNLKQLEKIFLLDFLFLRYQNYS